MTITCSPVAPHNNVKAFDGSTVTIGPAGECSIDDFRLSVIFPINNNNKISKYSLKSKKAF